MMAFDRDRRHRQQLERINHVQVLAGHGDEAHVDHERTLFERARLLTEEMRSHQATEAGLAALDRLLRRLEQPGAAHARDVAEFVDAVWNRRPLPLVTLRGLDLDTGDDMLAVLDAYRHARLSLVEQVPGGPRRVGRVLRAVLAPAA